MLEAARDSLQNLDWILARLRHAMATIEPRSKRQDDNDKCVPENRDKEEQSRYTKVSEFNVIVIQTECRAHLS